MVYQPRRASAPAPTREGLQLEQGRGAEASEGAPPQPLVARGEPAAFLVGADEPESFGAPAVQFEDGAPGEAGPPPEDVAGDYNAIVALAHLGTRRPQDDDDGQLDGVAQGIVLRLASANRIAHGLVPFPRRRGLQPGALRATDAAFGILRAARGLRAGRSGPVAALAHLLDVHRTWMKLPELNAEQFIASEPAPRERPEPPPRIVVEGSVPDPAGSTAPSSPPGTRAASPTVLGPMETGGTKGVPVPDLRPNGGLPSEPFLGTQSRETMILDARERVGAAQSAFQVAVLANAIALKDAAKKEAEMVALVVEVGLGLLVPGLSAGLVRKLTSLEKVLAPKEYGLVVDAFARFDNGKVFFTGATKAAAAAIKQNAKALFGDTAAEAFAWQLADAFHVQA